ISYVSYITGKPIVLGDGETQVIVGDNTVKVVLPSIKNVDRQIKLLEGYGYIAKPGHPLIVLTKEILETLTDDNAKDGTINSVYLGIDDKGKPVLKQVVDNFAGIKGSVIELGLQGRIFMDNVDKIKYVVPTKDGNIYLTEDQLRARAKELHLTWT